MNRREVLASILPVTASLAICDKQDEIPESLTDYLKSMGSPKINLSEGVKESMIRHWVQIVENKA